MSSKEVKDSLEESQEEKENSWLKGMRRRAEARKKNLM